MHSNSHKKSTTLLSVGNFYKGQKKVDTQHIDMVHSIYIQQQKRMIRQFWTTYKWCEQMEKIKKFFTVDRTISIILAFLGIILFLIIYASAFWKPSH